MNKIFIYTLILIVSVASGCTSIDIKEIQNIKHENKIKEIFTAVKVTDSNYVYSDESVYKINKKTYSLREKAIYNKNGDIEKLIIYKSEGILEYNKEKILNDIKILKYSGFPLSQKWRFINNNITDSNNNKISKATILNKYILMSTKDKKVIFYKIEVNNE